MQQLRLFEERKSIPLRGLKRVRKQSPIPGNVHWDLWTQEVEMEKEMALFFLDIRNFTPLAEKHSASDVLHIIKKIFSSFQHIIRINRGKIIETSGDGFYAAFGFDCNIRNAVSQAVSAGFQILRVLEDLNKRSMVENLGQRIEIGIGVHAGKVATGNIQLGQADHLVVMGYAVNVASRLQAATKELNNNFIVSDAVLGWLESPVASEARSIQLKGMKEESKVHLIGKAYNTQ